MLDAFTVVIDRDEVLDALYRVRAELALDSDAARARLEEAISLIASAPPQAAKAQYPRVSARNR